MAYESVEQGEKLTTSTAKSSKNMTLKEAIEFGEYDPAFLSTFPEWHNLSRYIQFQYIRNACDNRNKQLLSQWAEINNMLDFRLKPQLQEVLKNIENQWKKLEKDREKLYLEYSK